MTRVPVYSRMIECRAASRPAREQAQTAHAHTSARAPRPPVARRRSRATTRRPPAGAGRQSPALLSHEKVWLVPLAEQGSVSHLTGHPSHHRQNPPESPKPYQAHFTQGPTTPHDLPAQASLAQPSSLSETGTAVPGQSAPLLALQKPLLHQEQRVEPTWTATQQQQELTAVERQVR